MWRGRPRPRMPTTSKSVEPSKRKDSLLPTTRDFAGGGAHSTKKQRHGIKPCLINPGRAILLFLVVFLHGLNSAIMRGLCLGVFHGLFGFGSFFGASLGALFLLLVKDLFAA